MNLRIQFASLFNHLVTNGLFDLLIVIPPLLDLAILALTEPVPVGQGHYGTGALVLSAWVIGPFWVLG